MPTKPLRAAVQWLFQKQLERLLTSEEAGVNSSMGEEGQSCTVPESHFDHDVDMGDKISGETDKTNIQERRSYQRPGSNQDTGRIEALNAQLVDEKNRLQAELAKMNDLLQDKAVRLWSAEEMMERQGQEIHHLSARYEKQAGDMKRMDAELRHIRSVYEQANQLLKERTDELSTAEKFLGKADTISPSEIAALVGTLNAEISQVSNFMADSLSCQKWGSKDDEDERKKLERLLGRLEAYLGPWLRDNLWRRLTEAEVEFDPLVTQIAFQTGLVSACAEAIRSWNLSSSSGASMLSRVHKNMAVKVGQVIAGRWRVLTHTHNVGPDQESKSRNAIKKRMRNVSLDLIAAVGGTSVGSEYYNDKVDNIIQKALELHECVWRGMASMDLLPYVIVSGKEFDPARMEDADGRGKTNSTPKTPVMCTMEMGLEYKKSVPSNEQSGFETERGVIVKAKVLMADAFGE